MLYLISINIVHV